VTWHEAIDKRLKLDKPFMSNLESVQPRPIKVTDPVPNNIKADEKAIENAKTGKVTVEVGVIYIFSESKCNSHSTEAEISAKKA
jgi:hypothetical protein